MSKGSKCGKCNGTGYRMLWVATGTGWMAFMFGRWERAGACPACRGTGKKPRLVSRR